MIHQDKKLYLVFEYLDVDLKKHLETHPHIGNDKRAVKGFVYQMCAGIAYCHSHRCALGFPKSATPAVYEPSSSALPEQTHCYDPTLPDCLLILADGSD